MIPVLKFWGFNLNVFIGRVQTYNIKKKLGKYISSTRCQQFLPELLSSIHPISSHMLDSLNQRYMWQGWWLLDGSYWDSLAESLLDSNSSLILLFRCMVCNPFGHWKFVCSHKCKYYVKKNSLLAFGDLLIKTKQQSVIVNWKVNKHHVDRSVTGNKIASKFNTDSRSVAGSKRVSWY